MRLWSVHPRYLDAKGLVALWREGLLARKVLLGGTRGYRHHPQLERFLRRSDPVRAIDAYLLQVWQEASLRGYSFDRRKLGPATALGRQPVRRGQVRYEWEHLLSKLHRRDRRRWFRTRGLKPECHPVFRVVPGGIEAWERVRPLARK
jgi:hypothetical protein